MIKQITAQKLTRIFFTYTIIVSVFAISTAINNDIKLALISSPLYIIWICLMFVLTKKQQEEKILRTKERALEEIKKHLTKNNFSVIHPIDKNMKRYERYGVIYRAKLDEEDNVIVILTDYEKNIYSKLKFDNPVVFVRMYIDKSFEYK